MSSRTLDLATLHLYKGSHKPSDNKMCVMEAVAYVSGEEWSAYPDCASPVIAAFLRSYNDRVDDEVRQSLTPFIYALVGTRGDAALESRRAIIAFDWIIRVHTPAWLRLAGLDAEADSLESLREISDSIPSPLIKSLSKAVEENANVVWEAAWAAGKAARGAQRQAAGVAAWTGACTAAWEAARQAAGAAQRQAAGAAAQAAAWAAALVAPTDALNATTLKLQATVPSLIQRMIDAK